MWKKLKAFFSRNPEGDIMGGPIQPDEVQFEFDVGDRVQVVGTSITGEVTYRRVMDGAKVYTIAQDDGATSQRLESELDPA